MATMDKTLTDTVPVIESVQYTVVTPVLHDGIEHLEKEPIFLTPHQAEPLLAIGAIS